MLLSENHGLQNMAGVLPLSLAQEGLWLFEQTAPGTPTYNIAEAWWLKGDLDINRLERALSEIVRRHETLRSAIGTKDGKACQIVFPPKPFPLTVIDLRSHSNADSEAGKLAEQDANRGFCLTQESLIRCALYQVEDRRYLFSICMHHIVSDAWSFGIFLHELAALYASESDELPKLPVQFGNFALWQREPSMEHSRREDLQYWVRQLQGAPPRLALPADFARPAVETHKGTTLFFTWPESRAAELKDFAKKTGATTFRVLLASFAVLLQRYSLQDDIVIGSPFAGRDELETEGLIGFLVNTLALRIDLSGDPTFTELLRRVGGVTMSANLHQRTPLHHIVRELGRDRNLSAHTLFQAVFGWQKDFEEGWSLSGIEARRVEIDNGTSKFDLTMLVTEGAHDLRIRVEYSVDLYERRTIERLGRQFRMLVEGVIVDPSRHISEYPLDTAEEQKQVLEWGIGAVREFEKDSCVHEIFEAHAARNPSAVALAWGDEKISYDELNHRANLLAARLQQAGARAETNVAICLDRSMELIVGLLGILKMGAAYVPLDPVIPSSRKAVMLEDAQAEFVLTLEKFRSSIPARRDQILSLDDSNWPSNRNAVSPENPHKSRARGVAYVMYTSGSTGRPKGVAVSHRSIARLVRNTDYVQILPSDVFLQLAPISFDASTFEIWGALLNGARLVIHPPQMPSVEELGRVLAREEITMLWLTAGWFNQMIDGQLSGLQGLRYLLAGGEALSVPHVLKAARALKDCQLVNGYGPTEGATFTCCFPVPKNWRGHASVPIGRPIANTQVYILDAAMRPVAEGAIGELHIGGDGVARGYVNRPELTSAKFVQNPFGKERLYRTGDLVRWLSDGNIEFLGRKDDQVKIRGFRVEPGEIEAALVGHEAVREALVIARPDFSGTKQLIAYVVLHSNVKISSQQLRDFLAIQLPAYMVPSHIVTLDKLPLTLNGKVDRNALPSPEQVSRQDEQIVVAPSNETETRLLEIWREILQHENMGIHGNFFQLGGHSLLATQIISRIARVFQVELPVRVIFETPTIAGLATAIQEYQKMPTATISTRAEQCSRAQMLLERLDDLSDSEVEELLVELEEEEIAR
ncbi:MAG TPA: amino acid adenylation domain-containing protein [Verrucomicrobiae bacterium]|jgi:aspartate racemase